MNKAFFEKWQVLKNLVEHVQKPKDTECEPFSDIVFKKFCQDCFVYDSNPLSNIDQDMDRELFQQLFITYIEYMLNKDELQRFLDSMQMCQNKPYDKPFYAPHPYGSVIMPNVKTLQYAKFSPLILKLNEIRIHNDQMKKTQSNLIDL